MTATIAACPACGGAQFIHHPAGILEFDHHPACLIRDSEDSRRWADYEFANTEWPFGDFVPNSRNVETHQFDRPATDTERTLLAALGFVVSELLVTTVTYVSRTTRRRTWHSLQGAQQ